MTKKSQPWYKNVAAAMIRDRLSFRAALQVLNIAVPLSEADAIEASAGFRKMLDQEQALLYQELAANPNFNKQMVVGGMLHAIQQLIREGSFEKASEAWFKLARVQDWVGAESNINVMLGVSQKDIEAAKQDILKRQGLTTAIQ